jgi:signal peptidase I
MTRWARLLRRLAVAAAVLVVGSWLAPRFGVVYVGGWSMAPTFDPGDVAIYRKYPDVLRARDIVFVSSAADPRGTVHRVVAVAPDGSIRTQGDANPVPDIADSRPEDVAGVVVASLPFGRGVHAVVSAVTWCYNHVPIANMRR